MLIFYFSFCNKPGSTQRSLQAVFRGQYMVTETEPVSSQMQVKYLMSCTIPLAPKFLSKKCHLLLNSNQVTTSKNKIIKSLFQ